MPLTSHNTGVLDKRVTLLQHEISINSIGAPVDTWEPGGVTYGRWTPVAGREFFGSHSPHGEAAGILRIRYREGILDTWRVSFGGITYGLAAPVIEVGRRSYLDLVLKTIAGVGNTANPTFAIFEVDLRAGVASKAVLFPVAFQSAPQTLLVQLISPDGSQTFTATATSITASGFTAEFSAEVPAAGYKLSVQAFRYATNFLVDCTEGVAFQQITYATAFPSSPRGISTVLLPPTDGFEFTAVPRGSSRTAEGFIVDYGAAIPGPGYKLHIQITL